MSVHFVSAVPGNGLYYCTLPMGKHTLAGNRIRWILCIGTARSNSVSCTMPWNVPSRDPQSHDSWTVSGIHNKRLLQCTGQNLLHHSDSDWDSDRIYQDVQSSGYALHNAAAPAGQYPDSSGSKFCITIFHLLRSTRGDIHHGTSVFSAFAGGIAMKIEKSVKNYDLNAGVI